MSVFTVEIAGRSAQFDESDRPILEGKALRLHSSGRYVETAVKLENGKWRTTLVHRLLTNATRGTLVDHINGDGLDNRRANLRLATQAENARNKKAMGMLPVAGVRKSGQKFSALISPAGLEIPLGTYSTVEDAGAVYRAAAEVVFQDFARQPADAHGRKLLRVLIEAKRAHAASLLQQVAVLEGKEHAAG